MPEKPRRILVCDDNALLADLLTHHLTEAGFDVDLAADGGEALEKARAARYDAVVLDAMMPVLSGFDVMRALNDDPRAAPPIVMLTGLSDDSDVKSAMALGAAEFMVKPFNPDELIIRLRRLFEPVAIEPREANARA